MIAALAPAQELLFLPLHLRALDSRAPDPILGDTTSAELAGRLDYDFARLQADSRILVAVHAARALTLDDTVRRFVAEHPDAVVVDLGSGLDPRVHRCAPPSGVDWYDVDVPQVVRLRERVLPGPSHLVAADVTTEGWLSAVPADRPTIVVFDGLMALLPGPAFIALLRALTTHFGTGEVAFNAYHPIAVRQRSVGPGRTLGVRIAGDGFIDPHEPESWDAGLTLIEEMLIARSPAVAKYPPPWRTFARLTAGATRFHRTGDRIVRYAF